MLDELSPLLWKASGGGRGRSLGHRVWWRLGHEGCGRGCWDLGCGAAEHTPAGTLYLPVTEEDQPIFIQGALCNGTEAALAECEQLETFDCGHDEDAGAVCEGRWWRGLLNGSQLTPLQGPSLCCLQLTLLVTVAPTAFSTTHSFYISMWSGKHH